MRRNLQPVPGECGDTFSPKVRGHQRVACLYTAKGTAALLVPFSSVITSMNGNWHAVFMLAAGMAALSALFALFVLKPMRHAHTQKHARASSMEMSYSTPAMSKAKTQKRVPTLHPLKPPPSVSVKRRIRTAEKRCFIEEAKIGIGYGCSAVPLPHYPACGSPHRAVREVELRL